VAIEAGGRPTVACHVIVPGKVHIPIRSLVFAKGVAVDAQMRTVHFKEVLYER